MKMILLIKNRMKKSLLVSFLFIVILTFPKVLISFSSFEFVCSVLDSGQYKFIFERETDTDMFRAVHRIAAADFSLITNKRLHYVTTCSPVLA